MSGAARALVLGVLVAAAIPCALRAQGVVPVGGVRFLSSLEVRSVSFGDPTPEEVVDTLPAERTTDELGRPLDPAELKRKMRQAEKALEDWLS